MQLMRIFGIRIGVDTSWFFVLFIAIYLLQDSFKDSVQGSDTTAYLAAVAAAFSFFGSIVLHEIGHALAARREGIHVAGIDLFFFGGLMRMSSDTSSPGAEFRVAVAGPVVTLLIVLAGTGLGVALQGWTGFWDVALLSDTDPVGVPLLLLAFLVPMNIALLVFNLVPAFPLDGGRMARAVVWKVTGNRARATRVSAALGQGFGWILIGLGLYVAFATDRIFDGLWLAVLGWLLGQSARGAVVQSAVTQRLEGITVADVMDAEPVTIPAELSARQGYEDFFLRYHDWDWFAVVDAGGRYLGRVQRVALQTAADGEETVGAVTPADDEGRVPADAPLEALLGSDALRRLGSLMAVDAEGRLRGVVTLDQVSQALRSRLAPG
jgi:Zn-dependent protease